MPDTQRVLEEFDTEMGTGVFSPASVSSKIYYRKFLITKIKEAVAEERSELLLELLQVFNDYDVPLTMTAEQVRDILGEYLATNN